MKAQACSLSDLRRLAPLLDPANNDRLRGQVGAFLRCTTKSTRSRYRSALQVLRALRGCDIATLRHVQPSHLTEIAIRAPKGRWRYWVSRCERERLRVAALQGLLRAEKAARDNGAGAAADDGDRWRIRATSMGELLGSVRGVHAIITDPPYERDSLPVYGELARLAPAALAPGGIVAVFCGQAWLPEVLAAMTPHLRYRWCFAYLTVGGPAPRIWPRHIWTFWKPVLVFGGGRWCSDLVRCPPDDGDKDDHPWGQSVGGMGELISRLTRLGELVCDPFLGAGTTGVAALRLGRRFVGGDRDAAAVEIARGRLAACGRTRPRVGRVAKSRGRVGDGPAG